MTDRFKHISSAYLFFIAGNKILLLRRFQTGYEDGNYSVPAGHLEEHETIKKTAIREAAEEVGVTIHPTDIDVAHIMHRKQADERIDFFFVPKKWTGELKNNEPDKCDDLSWFALDNLPTNTIPYIRAAILSYMNKELYSELGWS